jgi:hypothetical protein
VRRFLELSADLEIRVEDEFYDRLETAPTGPKMVPNGPKMVPNGPKMVPNGPKMVHDDRSATDDELQKQAVEFISR